MKSKILLASVMLAGSVLTFYSAEAQQKTESRQSEVRGTLSVTSNSVDGSGETMINYAEDDHRYKIRMNGSKIVEMYVDGTKVPEEDYSKYDSLVKKIMAQIEKDRQQAEKDRQQAEKDRQQAERDREQADKDRQQADHDREQAAKDREQAVKDREQAERDREQADKDREQAKKDRAQAEEDRKLLNSMIDELVSDKIIESRDALTSLELDDSVLTVNGKEQTESVYRRYKEKYLKSPHSRINYRNSGSSRNLSFN